MNLAAPRLVWGGGGGGEVVESGSLPTFIVGVSFDLFIFSCCVCCILYVLLCLSRLFPRVTKRREGRHFLPIRPSPLVVEYRRMTRLIKGGRRKEEGR